MSKMQTDEQQSSGEGEVPAVASCGQLWPGMGGCAVLTERTAATDSQVDSRRLEDLCYC